MKSAMGIIVVLVLLSGCVGESQSGERVLNVGLLLARGGLGDRSFNDSAYAGLQEAQQRFGIRFKTADSTSDDANLEALRRFARQEYDLIIGIGFESSPYLKTVAKEFPDRHFAIIDAVIEGENVASIVYRDQEGDFLMGVLAAMLTKTKIVGFIGGADVPAIRRAEGGFMQGVAYQDGSVKVISELAGTFADPELGQALALAQYAAGADIIYNAAGRTGLGVIEAAKATGKLTIGASGDQRDLAPGYVVGNRLKRIDDAVLTLIEDVKNGRFAPGVYSLGLAEGGVALGFFDENIVTDAMSARLESLKQQIIAGEIAVIDVTAGE